MNISQTFLINQRLQISLNPIQSIHTILIAYLYTHHRIHHHYYSICREGAAQFGEEFLEIWLKTTYLADGVTSVYKWEKKEFQGGVKWKNQEDSY